MNTLLTDSAHAESVEPRTVVHWVPSNRLPGFGSADRDRTEPDATEAAPDARTDAHDSIQARAEHAARSNALDARVTRLLATEPDWLTRSTAPPEPPRPTPAPNIEQPPAGVASAADAPMSDAVEIAGTEDDGDRIGNETPALPGFATQSMTIGDSRGMENIVVVAQRQTVDDTGTHGRFVDVLRNEALRVEAAGTLGDTLDAQLGVHNASFGPGVGLPVVRGLSGSRLRIQQDGLGSWDASSISPDHATTVESISAREVEIIRGPAAVRYGGNAIGGVVEVRDGRIATEPLEAPTEVVLEQRLEVVNESGLRTTSASVDQQIGDVVLHAGIVDRSQDDISIPGLALDELGLFQWLGSVTEQNSLDFTANTDLRGRAATAGVSWVTDRGNLGVAYGRTEYEYGIPAGAHTEPASGAREDGHIHRGDEVSGTGPDIRVDMVADRFDLKSELLAPNDRLTAVRLRLGYVSYTHSEFEADLVASTFDNEVLEARLELDHAPIGPAEGTLGLQGTVRDFAADGFERYIPGASIRSVAAFITERVGWRAVDFEFGSRFEWQEVEQLDPYETDAGLTVIRSPMQHTAGTLSAAARWSPREDLSIDIALARAQRAPDVQELLSLGTHLATRTYDIGDPQLSFETFDSAEVGFELTRSRWSLMARGYYNAVSDYIFQRNSGIVFDLSERLFRINCVRLEECVPVMRYEQQDASIRGMEGELRADLLELGALTVEGRLFGDLVTGTLDDNSTVPRLPPPRIGAGLAVMRDALIGDLRLTHAFALDDTGTNEPPVDAYWLLDASLHYTLNPSAATSLDLFVRGRNLLDSEIRNATSLLRLYTPEPGRGVELGVRLEYR